MPKDLKYGEVTLENQRNIGDNEPVFVLRAQDSLTIETLRYYRYLCELNGSPENHLLGIYEAIERIKMWQNNHAVHIPDSVRLDTDKIHIANKT